jgi:hypothetical protein
MALILKDIFEDTWVVKQLHYDCKDFVSPLDYQEISGSFLTEYCLLYHFEKPDENIVDEGIEMYLEQIIDSNINSKFLTSLLLQKEKNEN